MLIQSPWRESSERRTLSVLLLRSSTLWMRDWGDTQRWPGWLYASWARFSPRFPTPTTVMTDHHSEKFFSEAIQYWCVSVFRKSEIFSEIRNSPSRMQIVSEFRNPKSETSTLASTLSQTLKVPSHTHHDKSRTHIIDRRLLSSVANASGTESRLILSNRKRPECDTGFTAFHPVTDFQRLLDFGTLKWSFRMWEALTTEE